MWLLVLGCTTPPSPAETLKADLETLEREVRRAARSEAQTCSALSGVIDMAPRLNAAIRDSHVTWEDVEADAIGLARVNGVVRPDWPELSLAVGPGKTGSALITVGGVLRPEAPCTDLAVLTRWMTRIPTLQNVPECVRPSLMAQIDADVVEALERCVCSEPDEDPTPVLASRLKNAGLMQAHQAALDSVGKREVCPTSP